MLYGRYEFRCRFESDAVLPRYKGSTFRGVFGKALKRVVCAFKGQECEQCLLRDRCIYAIVFESSSFSNATEGSRVVSPPHPFVIEPPLDQASIFPAGTSFIFHLLLFGGTNQDLPYFIYAFDEMGKIGIGRRVNGERGRFILQEVRAGKKSIYSKSDNRISDTKPYQQIELAEPVTFTQETFQLNVKMLTPLRVKYKNRLKAGLPFHVLVRAMLRRISNLFNHYGDGEPPLDYPGLVKKAENIRIADSNLEWFDWRRYSKRQERGMIMGGITGAVTYEGDLSEYVPLLDFCSKVHIGKQTSFGLGKIQVDIRA